MVEWCQANLPGEFRVNRMEPPSPYPDESFDLVYAISVLTHLTEELGRAWVEDWKRILRPTGKLLVSVHGDAYREQLGRRQKRRYDSGEIVVHHGIRQGTNICATHHPPAYAARLLGEVESHRPGIKGEWFAQDLYLVRQGIS
jgi:predicted SAM-dependent methyltransferase